MANFLKDIAGNVAGNLLNPVLYNTYKAANTTSNLVNNAINDSKAKQEAAENHYVYWLGEDGNVWVNKGGNTFNIGKPKGDLNSGYASGSMGSMTSKGTMIDNPNKSAGNDSSNTYQYDAALAAANAEKARRASEAANIKGRALGRRAEFTDVLNGILKNIEDVYGEESSKRKETLDKDSAELISQLEKAIPGIGASFAAIGAYDSSWNNDAQAETKEEHNKAQEELESEYNEDLKTLGSKRNEAITGANNAYQNFMTDFDALNETTANSDNLESIRQSENSLLKGLNNFKAQGDYYKPGSQLQSEMAGLGNYNGQKAIDAFGSFLNTAGAGASGVKAGGAEVAAAAKKNGKEKSELEQNKATGVSK